MLRNEKGKLKKKVENKKKKELSGFLEPLVRPTYSTCLPFDSPSWPPTGGLTLAWRSLFDVNAEMAKMMPSTVDVSFSVSTVGFFYLPMHV